MRQEILCNYSQTSKVFLVDFVLKINFIAISFLTCKQKKFIQFALFPLACFPFQTYTVFGIVKKKRK